MSARKPTMPKKTTWVLSQYAKECEKLRDAGVPYPTALNVLRSLYYMTPEQVMSLMPTKDVPQKQQQQKSTSTQRKPRSHSSS